MRFTGELVSLNPDGTGRQVHAPDFMSLYGEIDLNPEGDQVVSVESDNSGNARLRYVDVPSADSGYVTAGDGSDAVAVTSADEEAVRPQWQPCSR